MFNQKAYEQDCLAHEEEIAEAQLYGSYAEDQDDMAIRKEEEK